jgi:hypothetical protein
VEKKNMRELTAHKVNSCNEAITIEVWDEPGQGGACHHYRMTIDRDPGVSINSANLQQLFFQNGPIAEVGTNGITHEALLAILVDRLQGFQSGPFACDTNADALRHVKDAMECLHGRTRERMVRGVEGTHNK